MMKGSVEMYALFPKYAQFEKKKKIMNCSGTSSIKACISSTY